ncbi:HlyD family type I secretion periplasmic adaptor subunit [Azohydromonas caseinilytica]|uniref:Membrane fusion protein (MFP) family protein n=1 Tax=Azohydromonas caseinilytica TaxID=2728836 RepID=A0A848F9J2_9BURK|nr:HlyD family type I secretion periplasmic adaptor subunit [Azohydromonas caseinilytica]NML15003.1 HlyD family type I secretion periplasmic adaptor subunit [Azohydromonas caseinilytica]
MLNRFIDALSRNPRTRRDGDAWPAIRLGLGVGVLGFGGFLAWAAWAPLDQAVPGMGMVAVADQRKAVQHVSGGRIESLLVAEGDSVQAGQLLLKLDPRQLQAELDAAQAQLALANAALARVEAASAGRDSLPASTTAPADPRFQAIGLAQQSLLRAQLGARQAEVQQLQATRAQLEAQLEGHRRLAVGYREQLAIMERQHEALVELVAEGNYPKLRLLDLERTLAELRTNIAQSESEAKRTARAIEEASASLNRRQREQVRDLETERATLVHDAAALQARVATLTTGLQQTELRAPVAGQVVGLAVHTIGGVVAPGEKLMEIVPQDNALLVEAKLPVNMANKLKPGQPAQLHFSSSDRVRLPDLEGQVLTVSADKLEDQRSGTPYLLTRITIPESERAKLPTHNSPLRAGMPVDVLVRVGERSFLDYVMEPVTARWHQSMTE